MNKEKLNDKIYITKPELEKDEKDEKDVKDIFAEEVLLDDKVIILNTIVRNRQEITKIINLRKDINKKKLLKDIKRKCLCLGCIKNDIYDGDILILSGNQKENLLNFFVNNGIYEEKNILLKGI